MLPVATLCRTEEQFYWNKLESNNFGGSMKRALNKKNLFLCPRDFYYYCISKYVYVSSHDLECPPSNYYFSKCGNHFSLFLLLMPRLCLVLLGGGGWIFLKQIPFCGRGGGEGKNKQIYKLILFSPFLTLIFYFPITPVFSWKTTAWNLNYHIHIGSVAIKNMNFRRLF